MGIDTHECSISAFFFFFFALSLAGGEGWGSDEHTVTYDKPELREQLQSKADAGTAPSE